MKILEFQRIDELIAFEIGWNRLLFKSLDTRLFSKKKRPTQWWKHFRKGKELEFFTAASEGLLIPVAYSTIKVVSSKHYKAEFVAVGDVDYQAFSIDQFLSQLLLEEVIKRNE